MSKVPPSYQPASFPLLSPGLLTYNTVLFLEPYTLQNTAYAVYDEHRFEGIVNAFRHAYERLTATRHFHSLVSTSVADGEQLAQQAIMTAAGAADSPPPPTQVA